MGSLYHLGRFTDPGRDPAVAQDSGFILAITNMLDDQPNSFSIPEVVIGRSPTCGYIIHNETVSSTHARLAYHHDQWWVEDLRSTNGTFLNDEKITTATVIMNDDDLRCGQVSMRVSIEEPGSHS